VTSVLDHPYRRWAITERGNEYPVGKDNVVPAQTTSIEFRCPDGTLPIIGFDYKQGRDIICRRLVVYDYYPDNSFVPGCPGLNDRACKRRVLQVVGFKDQSVAVIARIDMGTGSIDIEGHRHGD